MRYGWSSKVQITHSSAGIQSGDREATTPREDQQCQIIDATIDFLDALNAE
jgi:hypothetical protein